MKTGHTKKPLFTKAIVPIAMTGEASTAKALKKMGNGTVLFPTGMPLFSGRKPRDVKMSDHARLAQPDTIAIIAQRFTGFRWSDSLSFPVPGTPPAFKGSLPGT